jgi:hypothetical protein
VKSKAGMMTQPSTQNVLSFPQPPLAVVRITSPLRQDDPRHARPWFLVHKPPRPAFVDEIIEMVYGFQADGSRHTWTVN